MYYRSIRYICKVPHFASISHFNKRLAIDMLLYTVDIGVYVMGLLLF